MILNKLQFIILICFIQAGLSQKLSNLKKNHKSQTLSDSEVDYVSDLTDTEHLNQLYKHIAVPRVVGTDSHKKVHNFIVEQLKSSGFSVEIDDFEERTPNKGILKFRNIIGRLNPDADRFLVLSCHYDSKYFKNEEFIGATDSAVPCAMILNLAKTLQNELNEIKDKKDVSLMLLFFDGEEAFKTWSATDSIYGARHLAEKWQKSVATRSGIQANHLERIDALVLLDLLGTPDPTFFSYFPETEKLFVQMSDAEDKLAARGHFKDYAINNPKQKYFKRRYSPSYVEDDHIPFYIRGVPILHLIPKEFPKVWHKLTDTMDVIDHNTVENLNKILRVFVAEYLHLPVTASSTGNGNRKISNAEL